MFTARRGGSSYQQGTHSRTLCVDSPATLTLSSSFSDFSTEAPLRLIGANPRFESTALGTTLRRQARRSARFTLVRTGSFGELRIPHNHLGNSLRVLHARLENRLSAVQSGFVSKVNPRLVLGAESLRASSSSSLQKIAAILGSRLFTVSLKGGLRFGILHASLGSLAFASLGASSHVQSSPRVSSLASSSRPRSSVTSDTGVALLPTLDAPNLVFTTHAITASSRYAIVPTSSLYERSGRVVNVEGKTRRSSSVLGVARRGLSVSSVTPEVYITSAQRSGRANLSSWLTALWSLDEVYPFVSSSDSVPPFRPLSPALLNAGSAECSSQQLSLFHEPSAVREFYTGGSSDALAQASPVRHECSLYLGRETNFSLTRLAHGTS